MNIQYFLFIGSRFKFAARIKASAKAEIVKSVITAVGLCIIRVACVPRCYFYIAYFFNFRCFARCSEISGSEESIFNKLPWCTPFTYLSKGLYQNMYANAKGKIAGYETGKLVDWTTPDFRSILLWFGITVVLFFCAMIVYKKRKAEIGGFIGKNNVLNFLCTFTIGFYGFVLAYSFSSTYIGKWPSLAISCLIFAVVYFVLDIIFIRNLKLFAKGLKAYYRYPDSLRNMRA